ncbi:Repeat domain in Vibrio, Colwellia, Bradyrhizobium and Shewanella [anaerobic digester metagenome]
MNTRFTALINAALCLLLLSTTTKAQTYRAVLETDGSVNTIAVSNNIQTTAQEKLINQLPGWPVKMASNASFKNMRCAAAEDIDADGSKEILVASNNLLCAYNDDGSVLWTKILTGTAIYPPTIGDMNNDGLFEIAQATGGSPANGRIYLLDNNGNDIPGWPLNHSDHWILCSPVMADVNEDSTLELIYNERVYPQGNLHIRNMDGTSFSANWPVVIDATPSVTPSVGDIDGDGNKEIILCSYNDILAFDLNGALKAGFPVLNTNTTFSYQSPLLVDLDGDGTLNIVGSTIGDVPEFYVLNHDGTYHNGWPVAVPDGNWTYCPPAVADLNQNGNYSLFFTRPINDTILPMLFGFDKNAVALSSFPMSARGGDEGIVTIADVDGDSQYEIVTGSNLCDGGLGFIHAFEIDGSGEAAGFPLTPQGFSFMNGANLSDINSDGLLELISVSYDQTFTATDSTIINVYALNVPCNDSTVLFGTYKGSNLRNGLITSGLPPYSVQESQKNISVSVHPNPASDFLFLDFKTDDSYSVTLINAAGQVVYMEPRYHRKSLSIDLKNYSVGRYQLKVENTEGFVMKRIVVER